jgi:hypothetical protein
MNAFNLCRPISKLFEHLTRNSHEAVLRLRRKGIDEAVRNPLRLAGHTDLSEQNAVIDSIRRDITDRAGDLALVQMAINAADKGERHKQRDQWAAKTLRDLRIAEIAQLVGAILDGKVEAYPARVATARFFAAHLANAAPGLTTTVIGTSVAVDVERIG